MRPTSRLYRSTSITSTRTDWPKTLSPSAFPASVPNGAAISATYFGGASTTGIKSSSGSGDGNGTAQERSHRRAQRHVDQNCGDASAGPHALFVFRVRQSLRFGQVRERIRQLARWPTRHIEPAWADQVALHTDDRRGGEVLRAGGDVTVEVGGSDTPISVGGRVRFRIHDGGRASIVPPEKLKTDFYRPGLLAHLEKREARATETVKARNDRKCVIPKNQQLSF
jgi:hypothetical protein